MARNVALSEKAYEELSKRKSGGESFSNVVLRLISREEKKPSLREFFGVFKDDEEIGKIYDKILEDRHKKPARGPRFKW